MFFIIFINEKKTEEKHANPQVADNQNHTASERDWKYSEIGSV